MDVRNSQLFYMYVDFVYFDYNLRSFMINLPILIMETWYQQGSIGVFSCMTSPAYLLLECY